MKEHYILATDRVRPVSQKAIRVAFESADVELVIGKEGCLFSVRANGARTDVRFETTGRKSPFRVKELSGREEAVRALRRAKSIYRFAFDAAKPQPSVAVFEALWCVRSLIEEVGGVLVDLTALKVHEPDDVLAITELEFDIRDHMTLHATEATEGKNSLWVHSHGMEKFGVRDVEVFNLTEEDLPAAQTFLQQLCTDLAFGHGPPVRAVAETGPGEAFMLLPAEEARGSLMGVPLTTFEGHEGLYYTAVAPSGRHTLSEMLLPYRERFEEEPEEQSEALRKEARERLPAFKARFLRKGLMEPLTFLVRASFETRVEGGPVSENLWLEVLRWEGSRLVGKLADGSAQTTEWRKGVQVDVEEDVINAIAIARDGKPLEEEDMENLLVAERPM